MSSIHPDLKITIPRPHLWGPAAPYWALVRTHGRSRKAMVNFICGIGGYQSHGERSAIEFNVKAYGADLDADNLWKLLVSGKMDVGPDPKLPPEHLAQAKALFWRVYDEHRDHLWEWAIEEAYDGWKDSDTPFETFASHRIDWDHSMAGRSGGHLIMTECEGIDLRCSEDDLEEKLMEKEPPSGAYVLPHWKVRALFIICVQNSVDLTPQKASEEVEYRAAWRLWVSFCEDELEKVLATYEQRQELSEAAGKIEMALSSHYGGTSEGQEYIGAFRTICGLADVRIGK